MAQSKETQGSPGLIFASKSKVYHGPFGGIVEVAIAKTVMRTWSHAEEKRRPCSQSEAMVVFGDSIGGAQRGNPMMRGDRLRRNYSVAIFGEPRANPERHLHVIIDATSVERASSPTSHATWRIKGYLSTAGSFQGLLTGFLALGGSWITASFRRRVSGWSARRRCCAIAR